MAESTNIYGSIQSLDELRRIYRGLLAQLDAVETREQLDEVKTQSEYLCTLADSPEWRDEGDRGGTEALAVCREFDRTISEAATKRAEDLGLSGDAYASWLPGEDSKATRDDE